MSITFHLPPSLTCLYTFRAAALAATPTATAFSTKPSSAAGWLMNTVWLASIEYTAESAGNRLAIPCCAARGTALSSVVWMYASVTSALVHGAYVAGSSKTVCDVHVVYPAYSAASDADRSLKPMSTNSVALPETLPSCVRTCVSERRDRGNGGRGKATYLDNKPVEIGAPHQVEQRCAHGRHERRQVDELHDAAVEPVRGARGGAAALDGVGGHEAAQRVGQDGDVEAVGQQRVEHGLRGGYVGREAAGEADADRGEGYLVDVVWEWRGLAGAW